MTGRRSTHISVQRALLETAADLIATKGYSEETSKVAVETLAELRRLLKPPKKVSVAITPELLPGGDWVWPFPKRAPEDALL